MVRQDRADNCLHAIFSDCRLALRILRKSPAFATIAILTLAVGISACTVIFSVVYGVLVRPLPYPNLDRVVRVYMHFHPQDMEHGTMSDADFRDLETQNRSFEALGLFQEGAPFEISGKSGSELVAGAFVTASFFSTLGQQPLLGRSLVLEDEKMGSPSVVVLSERLWWRLFNAEPEAIGQSLRMSGQTYTLVGVMPQSFSLPSDQDELWTNYQLGSASKRGPWFSYAIGRLKPGVTLEEAQDVNEIGHGIELENPALYANLTLPLVSMRESIIGDVRPALLLIFGAVGFVLLIAVVNVSNLLLVRATSRLSEIAIRRSLGAGTARIALQLAIESLLLALAAGILGVFLSYLGVRASQVWHPSNLPRVADIRLDGICLAFICCLALVTGVSCSLLPAILALKTDLSRALKTGKSATSGSRSGHRPHSLLVVSEIALSVALLVGAGLLLRSFIQLRSVDAGFHAPLDNILTLKLRITQDRPINSPARIAIFERLLEKARTLPEVRTAAISRTVPPHGGPVGWSPFMVEGQTWDLGAHPSFPYLSISEDYFRALAIPLLKGRYFTTNDKADSTEVAIISDSFARRYFRGEDPLGKRIKVRRTRVSGLSLSNDRRSRR